MSKFGACFLTFVLTSIAFMLMFPLEVVKEVQVVKEIEVVKEVEVMPDTPDFDMEVWKSTYPYDVDCDDVALGTWIALERQGYECFGVFGNLELKGESVDDCNHVWIIAEIDGVPCYYENGKGYKLDKRHAEGYRLTKQDLLYFMINDLTDAELEDLFE